LQLGVDDLGEVLAGRDVVGVLEDPIAEVRLELAVQRFDRPLRVVAAIADENARPVRRSLIRHAQDLVPMMRVRRTPRIRRLRRAARQTGTRETAVNVRLSGGSGPSMVPRRRRAAQDPGRYSTRSELDGFALLTGRRPLSAGFDGHGPDVGEGARGATDA